MKSMHVTQRSGPPIRGIQGSRPETGGGPAHGGAGPPSHISRPVSRVLCGVRCEPDAWRPFLWNAGCPALRATHPDGGIRTSILERCRLSDAALHTVPIRFCSRWGLPCRLRYRKRGALLPHRFTLTAASPRRPPPVNRRRVKGGGRGGLFSVALSLGSPPPDVIRHRMSMEPGLSSPAPSVFPEVGTRRGGRPTDW